MILISIGANLPGPDGMPPLETCRRAAAALDALPGLQLVALSRWYASAPVLPAGQQRQAHPDYINGMAQLRSIATVAPAELLRRLMQLEAQAGRVRGEPNAPRVLDLDIVAMGGMVRDAPDPVLPHPRAHQRAFVLLPLAELAPGWVHPRLRRGVQALIEQLPPQEIRPL